MPLFFPEVYIVCYEFKNVFFNHVPLIQELQRSEKWFHYMDTCWIVKRKETVAELQTKLLSLIHQDDRLLILTARGAPGGWLPNEAWKWINENVPR